MKSYLYLPAFLFLISACNFEKAHIGLRDDFSNPGGWVEVLPSNDTVQPTVKMDFSHGALIIHHRHRSLEEAYKWCPWIKWERDFSTNLRKNYGVIDMDKYHYVVLNVRKKGSSSYFDINGFTTKLGYTTGTTVIDLKDYDHPGIKGTQQVDFGIDLQDNHTVLVLDELKFVSALNRDEKKKLIGTGLNIREEHLRPRPYHGLEALKERGNSSLPSPVEEEMAIFRDDATGAITTRLTADPGDDNFGEGGIWSSDGSAIKFESPRNIGGVPVCLPGEGKIIAGPARAIWNIWSPADPEILYAMKREGLKFMVSSWNKTTRVEKEIATFSVPEVGSYVEFKNFTPLGNLVVAFRETPHLFIVDVNNNSVRYIKLPRRLKDATVGKDEKTVVYANCYTFEIRSYNIRTGMETLAPSFSAGHASWGPHGMVANFGGHMNVFVPDTIGTTFIPADQISIWANWKNDIVTDYGSLTSDNRYVFTNGRNADVDSQHLMIPSADPGAVLRVARYFTKFSWSSTTYSRPSPDYTKLVYNENVLGNTELHLVYTRRPNCPGDLKLEGNHLTWSVPEPNREMKSCNIYASNQSGRNFQRINGQPVTIGEFTVDNAFKYYAVTCMENSGLESNMSHEVSPEGARSFYYEAEDMDLVPPARRYFNGYCSNFQTVRINAESIEEQAHPGIVRIALNDIPSGKYSIWGRVKGKGSWSAHKSVSSVSSDDWQWIRLGDLDSGKRQKILDISSSDDALMLDMVLLTTEDFIPEASCPPDNKAPQPIRQFKAIARGRNVILSWEPSHDKDFHHYSIYCGKTSGFECNNETVIRSVFKTSITDAVPGNSRELYYRIIAVDNRWNESEPAEIKVIIK